MISVKVVDASAIAALIFSESEGEAIRQRLSGAVLIAPERIDYEIVNICWKKIRKQPEYRDEFLGGLRLFQSAEIDRFSTPALEVVSLGLTHGLTAYDASYLWLAQSQNAELVTLDARLGAAAKALRLKG